jgi:hypothetical protein
MGQCGGEVAHGLDRDGHNSSGIQMKIII